MAAALLGGSALPLAAAVAAASQTELADSSPLEVRILYDNSGSMYPGYQPGIAAGSRAPFFRQESSFRGWLGDFVRAQSNLRGSKVSLATLTSNGSEFQPADLEVLQDRRDLAEFDPNVLDRLPPTRWGRRTYLAPAVDFWTREFTGLLWLITDNHPDSGTGTSEDEVVQFFRSLFATERFRAVHLYKTSLARGAVESNLAIYGILVSAVPIEREALSRIDSCFRDEMRMAQRSAGIPLFADHAYLKLKDWRLDPLELEMRRGLEPEIVNLDQIAQEGQFLSLKVPGELHSLLSQYTVKGGRYRLALGEPLFPDENSRLQLGAEAIAAEDFEISEGTIDRPIPPAGVFTFESTMSSRLPLDLHFDGFGSWLRAMQNGVEIVYSGTVDIELDELELQIEHDRMQGIFGIEHAARIFGFPEAIRLARQVDSAPISFVLRREDRRGTLLALVLFLLGAPVVAGVLFLRGVAHFRVTVAEQNEVFALRRLQRRTLTHQHLRLGILSRDIAGNHDFVGNDTDVALRVIPEQRAGWYQVQLREGGSIPPHIERLDRGHSRAPRPGGGNTPDVQIAPSPRGRQDIVPPPRARRP